ncbi:MAG: hypothetical protein ACI8RD_012743 [Bacillariaceae sp.]|jgi:hypothetical protein
MHVANNSRVIDGSKQRIQEVYTVRVQIIFQCRFCDEK